MSTYDQLKDLIHVKSESTINSEMQYLYDIIQTNISMLVQQMHREVCQSNQITLELLRNLANAGMTTIAVRSLLKDNRYIAKPTGDMISLFQCEEIFNYQLLEQGTEQCTLAWPIQYYHNY